MILLALKNFHLDFVRKGQQLVKLVWQFSDVERKEGLFEMETAAACLQHLFRLLWNVWYL